MATQDEQLAALNPGPVDGSLLNLQNRHRSQDIGEGKTIPRIRLIEHGKAFSQWTVTHGSVLALLRDAGMYYVSRLSRVILDHALLRALIERWRPETQTFHFRVGEMTITLRDVALLAALRIDGEPVTCTTLRDYKRLCVQLLGQAPDHIQAGCVKLKWLRVTFMHDIASDAPQEVVERYTRAYILYLFGSVLFPDPSGNKVNLKWLLFLEDFRKCGQFAWGAAVLAHIYRELGKVSLMGHTDCCCFLALVQLWAWEYLPFVRPRIISPIENQCEGGGQSTESEGQLAAERGQPAHTVESAPEVIQLAQLPEDSPVGCRWFSMLTSTSKLKTSNTEMYRNQLDLMKPSNVIWNPYSTLVIEALPDICRDHKEVWMSRTPLICIETVQMHVPDRVMRQFSLLQHIPEPVESIAAVTRQGKVAENWQAHHHSHVTRWQQRQQNIVKEHTQLRNAPNQAPLDAYMKWYWRVTRRWIITPSQQLEDRACQEQAPTEFALVDAIRYIHKIATDMTGSEMTLEAASRSLDQIAAHCSAIIQNLSFIPNGDSIPPPAPMERSTADFKHRIVHRRRNVINDQAQEDKRPTHRRRCDHTSPEVEVLEHPGSSSSGSDCIVNQSDDTVQSGIQVKQQNNINQVGK